MLFPLFAVHGSKGSVRCNPNRESLYGLLLLVRVVRVVRGSWNLKGSVPCSPEEVLEGEGGKVKRSVRSNSNREIRESLYCLFLLVRTVRVVRGS